MKKVNITRKIVVTLANRILVEQESRINDARDDFNDRIFTRSIAMKLAWTMVKRYTALDSNPYDLHLVRFEKKSGEVTQRVIIKEWFDFVEFKNTGRKKTEGLVKGLDVAKHIVGANRSIISYYENAVQKHFVLKYDERIVVNTTGIKIAA